MNIINELKLIDQVKMRGEGLRVRKGAWSANEDLLLTRHINKHGEGNWHLIPKMAGLNRCRKSCRLRWLNYLSPDIKRGTFAHDEIDLIVRLHRLLGNRWSLIAGRIPGRTANDVKNFWNTHLKRIQNPTCSNIPKFETQGKVEVIRPRARTLSRSLFSLKNKSVVIEPQTRVVDNSLNKTKNTECQNLSTKTLLEHEPDIESSRWSLKSPCNEVGANISSNDMSLEQRNDYWQQYLSISEMGLNVDKFAHEEETLPPLNIDWDNLSWENMDIWNLLRDE